ncbi:S-layer homology domain-containing protein [Butyricicoccus sp. AF35-5AC]|uniref:S-layer homology domain-containing protein n=1 Tax=Butyricicoccus sp. AF35-5AC TaxID=2292003 RepID=UPI001313EDD0|nr:S-layer homology domain-containing protein [Butyricicoccus sp. AF35-5AC]
MLKKNMRKRLLAGALATIMALTMCPTWALAGDEGITTLPSPEDQMSVVDSTSAEDAIQKTPDAETQGQTEPQDTAQAGQIENPDPAQAPSGGTDIEETGNNSNSNENDSQNNDAVSNSPANTISVQEVQIDRAWNWQQEAKYFVLLPNRDKPTSGESQGQESYLPNDTSDGGVTDRDNFKGYKGYLTAKGKKIADKNYSIYDATNGYTKIDGVESEYLDPPENLGFFTKANWSEDGKTYIKDSNPSDPFSVLGENFNVNNIRVVWYTIKYQVDGYHVDGYVAGVPVKVTYHSNYGTIPGTTDDSREVAAMSGDTYTVLDNMFTVPTGFSFGGWYVDGNKYEVGSKHLLMTDLHLYAKWIPNPYTVTWKISEDAEDSLDTQAVNYNGYPTKDPKDQASKASDAQYDYRFKGWKLAGTADTALVDPKERAVTADVTYIAVFEPVTRQYTVTWKNSDDAVDPLDTQAVNYNGYPTKDPKDQASKASDAQYTYEFAGWKLVGTEDTALVNPKEQAVTADVTYIAVFKPIARQYTVTWKNADDAVNALDTQTVAYNNKPTKDPKDQASKASDAQYTYEFAGWKLAGTADTALVDPTTIAVVKDVTYIAVFKPITRQYTVTYYVDGEKQGDEETYNYGTLVKIRGNAVKEGHTFSGWKIGSEAAKDFEIKSNVIIQGFFTQNTKHYTINKHFYNEKDVEVKAENGETKTGNEYALVAELYKDDAVNQTVDGKTYVYVPGLTKVTDNLEKLTKDVTIDLYYYLDVKGGEKPDETGNGTPDAWEYRLAFKVVNGEWNNGGNADIVVYVPFKDYKNGDELKYVVVPITRIPAVGDKPNSGYRAGSWDTIPVGNAKVEKDTVFTYTYARRSSSGGGGGGSRKPTVTIPDNVPTGLNGDDHYAYIVGYPDSTVRPQNGITRAEVATIFFRLLTDETRNANSTKSNSYSDVAAGAWYNHAVSTLSAMGIVKGDSQGKFNPNAPITRAEFAAIAARFDDKANTAAVDFSDIASHWAKNEISAAANNGWINGYTDGTFRPNNKITRAEAMTLVNRVLKRLPETAEDLHNDMIKWSDNSDTSAWYYLAVQEATNSHYYDIKENKHEKWSKLRETRDWTELEK